MVFFIVRWPSRTFRSQCRNTTYYHLICIVRIGTARTRESVYWRFGGLFWSVQYSNHYDFLRQLVTEWRYGTHSATMIFHVFSVRWNNRIFFNFLPDIYRIGQDIFSDSVEMVWEAFPYYSVLRNIYAIRIGQKCAMSNKSNAHREAFEFFSMRYFFSINDLYQNINLYSCHSINQFSEGWTNTSCPKK